MSYKIFIDYLNQIIFITSKERIRFYAMKVKNNVDMSFYVLDVMVFSLYFLSNISCLFCLILNRRG